MHKPTEVYGYSQVRTTLPRVTGVDKKGNGHTFSNVPAILNYTNGSQTTVTVLDRPHGKAIARLSSARF
jgi:hypothetical protein